MGEEKEVVVPEVKVEEKPVVAPVVSPPVKKYTDDDVNNIVVKKEAGAVERVLKELGIPTVEDAKKNLAALRAWQDSQKTESQRAIDAAKEAVEGKTAADRRADAAEMKVEALTLGVDPANLGDLIILAEKEEGKTNAEKVKAAIDKRPWLKATEKPAEFGGKIKGQTLDAKSQAKAQVDEAFGIKPKKA